MVTGGIGHGDRSREVITIRRLQQKRKTKTIIGKFNCKKAVVMLKYTIT